MKTHIVCDLFVLFVERMLMRGIYSQTDLNIQLLKSMFRLGVIIMYSMFYLYLETEKIITKRRLTKVNRASKIGEILETICDSPNRFASYEYSPPKTVKACKLLMENSEDDIETAFIKNIGGDNMVDHVCQQVTGACVGVNTKEKKRPSENADVELNSDGDKMKSQTITIDPSSGKVQHKKGFFTISDFIMIISGC